MKELELACAQGVLHHAYVFPRAGSLEDDVLSFIKDHLGLETRGNPNVYVHRCETFGIDDSRAVQSLASQRALGDSKKVFVLSCRDITREAQNSLLKTLEEPTADTHFFVIVENLSGLLPTLLSRMQSVVYHNETGDTLFAETFLRAKPAERLALLKDICESKDKHQAQELLNALESVLYQKLNLSEASPEELRLFTEIQDVRSYLEDRGVSVKMLLEHLALIVPRVA